MVVLGLRFCARAFSSCGKWGPLFIAVRGPSHYRGLSCCGAQAPDTQAQQSWLMGLVASRHVGSSQTRARTHVPCIGRQTLYHCATREARRWYSFGIWKQQKLVLELKFSAFMVFDERNGNFILLLCSCKHKWGLIQFWITNLLY